MISADTLKSIVGNADYKTKNEASELQFLRSGVPKNAHCLTDTKEKNKEQSLFNYFGLSLRDYLGGCSPSLERLNLLNARSIPCDKLANSFNSTIFSRNSIFSGDIVTFKEILFCFTIYNKDSCKVLYIYNSNRCLTKIIFVGDSKYETSKSISESCRAGDHNTDNSRMHREHISDVGHSCLRLVGYSGRSQRRDNLDRQQMRDPDLRPHSGSLQLIEVA